MQELSLTEIQQITSEAKQAVMKDIALREVLADRLASQVEQAAAVGEDISVLDKTAMLLNSLGEERQREAQEMIEGLVTRGLQSIFEPNLSLVISTSVKGKTTATEFLIRTENADGSSFETQVMDARGGGLVAVVAFLLRVTVHLLTSTEQSRFMLLDETFAHVSAEYQPAVGAFLRELVDETGLQVVMVTHSPEFEEHATSVLRFEQVDGRTKVAEVLTVS